MNEIEKFNREVEKNITELGSDPETRSLGVDFVVKTSRSKYSYNFSWMGRPIIQFPQDMIAMQEIIWAIKPDLVIETGIAHGGSLIFYASLLELIGKGKVIGIDIDIRSHNRAEIEQHPMAKRIEMIEGSSVDTDVVREVKDRVQPGQCVMVVLDSNHTHEHVARELELYADLVTIGSYCVVFDTVVEDMPKDSFPDRPWGVGNNPKTAVHEYLGKTDSFEIDASIHQKLLITVAPDGYLKRVR